MWDITFAPVISSLLWLDLSISCHKHKLIPKRSVKTTTATAMSFHSVGSRLSSDYLVLDK